MLECLILGDSIAVGVGHARPECQTQAVTGISSTRFLLMPLAAHMANTIVISLGANDSDAAITAGNVEKLRASLRAPIVYWLLAAGSPPLREAVRRVAARFHDRVIDVAPLAGPDGLHPDSAGYARLAEMTGSGHRTSPPKPETAYPAFLPPYHLYRAMPPAHEPDFTPPGVNVWNGPSNLNGHQTAAPKPLW